MHWNIAGTNPVYSTSGKNATYFKKDQTVKFDRFFLRGMFIAFLTSLGLHASSDALLVLSWHNAFCETHSHKKECRPRFNTANNRLVLHGLWPQPRSQVYCNVPASVIGKDKHHQWRALPAIRLPRTLAKLETIYFPGARSGLDRHEWIKHGTCYSSNPINYFADALLLTAQVDDSDIGKYLREHIGKKVRLATLRKLLEREFGPGTGNKLSMQCRRGLLSEIRISIHGAGHELAPLLRGAKPLHSHCVEAIVDAPGRFRR